MTHPNLRLRRVLLGTLAVAILVLMATNVWLVFWEVPTGAEAWSDIADRPRTSSSVVRSLLTNTGVAVLVLALGLLLTTVGEWVVARRVSSDRPFPRQWFAGLALPITAFLAFLAARTGYALAYDGLVLSAVKRVDMRGLWFALFDPAVMSVITDGRELSQATYRWTTLLNVVVLPCLLIGLALLSRTGRSRTAVPPAGEGPAEVSHTAGPIPA